MEQFSFLDNWQIHKATGIAQEGLHSIKVNNLKGMNLKIYLSKSYNRMSWLYIQMLLTHIGFYNDFINWIMCCITSVSYRILINGSITIFFHVEHGILQGCALSPLLFLLVMEGLSRLLTNERNQGIFKGVKILANIVLSHLLFIDDVLIFLSGAIRYTIALKNILKKIVRL